MKTANQPLEPRLLNISALIVEFEVFIRPSNSLRALGVEMARRLK